jgi:hypothetical protein
MTKTTFPAEGSWDPHKMSHGCPAVQEGGNKSMPMSSKEEQLTNPADELQRRRVGAKQLLPLIFPAVCNVLSIVIQVGTEFLNNICESRLEDLLSIY